MVPFLTNSPTDLPSKSGASSYNAGQESGPGFSLSNGLDQDKLEPIAVIGFSTRFPQDANSPKAFWQMLEEGRSAMTEVPEDRFNINSFYHSDASRHDRVSCS